MAGQGILRLIALFLPNVNLNPAARETFEIGRLLHTAKDCLRFVAESLEVISLSAPHVYHFALTLVPHSSMVWEMHRQYTPSSGRMVVTGFPSSLDPCTEEDLVTPLQALQSFLGTPRRKSSSKNLTVEEDIRTDGVFWG